MKYVTLGRSDLKVSIIGFGAWAIGGRHWGPVDDDESKAAVRRAVELGVNFFDTADVYGLGHSEELLGEALALSTDAVIATKVGLGWNRKGKIRHDLSPAHIKQACEASLRRLRREVIDLYQIHWSDPAVPLDDTVDALEELRREGKVRYLGACNLPLDDLARLAGLPGWVSYQGLYNLLDRRAEEELLPFCRRQKLAFVAYEPLAKGLLTGKFNAPPVFPPGDHRRHHERFGSEFYGYKEEIDRLAAAAAARELTLTQMALAVLLEAGATTVIPGVKTAAQIEESTGASEQIGGSALF